MAKRENQTSISLDPALKERAQIEALKRKTTLSQAIANGLEWWVGGDQQNQSTTVIPASEGLPQDEASVTFLTNLSRVLQKINKKDWKWIERLAGIFASGNKEAIDAVTQNIKVFEKFVELANNGTTSGAAQSEVAGEESRSVGRHATEHRKSKGDISKGSPQSRKTGTDGS